MNKRLIIFGVLLAALLLSAVSPWPATLTVGNYTGDNIYFTLKYRGEQKYFLTATPAGNAYNKAVGSDYHISRFDIVRRVYSATVTACQTTTTWGLFDMRTQVWLNFVPCEYMIQIKDLQLNPAFTAWLKANKVGPQPVKWLNKPPKFWGEPTMEKVTFYTPGTKEFGPPYGTWYGNYYVPYTGGKVPFRFLYNVTP